MGCRAGDILKLVSDFQICLLKSVTRAIQEKERKEDIAHMKILFLPY